MGLDMYAWVVPGEAVVDDFNFKLSDEKERPTELFYWRKHHDLHGWMEHLYYEKGGTRTFNCVSLRLTEEDLDALHTSIAERTLPPTTGFFFGDNSPNSKSDERDLEFIAKAREAITEGKAVYYDSWW